MTKTQLPPLKKRIILALSSTVLSMLAIMLFLWRPTSAILECDENGKCLLRSSTLFKKVERRFEWKDVKQAISSSSAQNSSSSQKRGSASTNLFLIFQDGSQIQVYVNNVGWLKGDLEYKNVDPYFTGGVIPKYLSGISYGGVEIIVSIILGSIAYILLLFAFIKPIVPDLSESDLSKFRKYNLVVFITSLAVSICLWLWILSEINKHLLN